MKGRLFRNGNVAICKELGHSHYCENRPSKYGKAGYTGSSMNRWMGMKTVIWNFLGTNNLTGVHVEVWVDQDVTDTSGNLVIRNDWKKLYETDDVGGWTTAGIDMTCECVNKDRPTSKTVAADEIVNTGANPREKDNLCAVRTDQLTSLFKFYSVREIQGPAA